MLCIILYSINFFEETLKDYFESCLLTYELHQCQCLVPHPDVLWYRLNGMATQKSFCNTFSIYMYIYIYISFMIESQKVIKTFFCSS